jgi:PTS system mannose-specific IIA component
MQRRKKPKRQWCDMIGVVLITHGGVGRELKAAAENMLGQQQQMETISVDAGVPLAQMREELSGAVTRVADGANGVLILSDIFGGTPCNVAAGSASPGEVIVLTGVNLPMLVAVVRARKRSGLVHVAQSGLEAGRHYIGFAEPPKDGSRKAAQWATQ